jgi:hypothetical protein
MLHTRGGRHRDWLGWETGGTWTAALSGWVSGFIAQVNYQSLPAKGQPTQDLVLIYPNWDDKTRKFADLGDSGSAIVDDNGYVLGLLWAITVIKLDDRKITCGVACKISNVEAALQVTVATAVGADAPLSPAETFTGRLEALCKPSLRTQAYFDAYMRHGDQIRHLFHENARLYRLCSAFPKKRSWTPSRTGATTRPRRSRQLSTAKIPPSFSRSWRDGLSQYVEDPTLQRAR